MKSRLESVVYDYVPATLTTEETKRTLMNQYRVFEPYEDDFMAQFTTELVFVIAEMSSDWSLWN